MSKFFIVKNSKEEDLFIKDVSPVIRNLDISDLSVIDKLENIVNILASNIKCTWRKNAKFINITQHSKC